MPLYRVDVEIKLSMMVLAKDAYSAQGVAEDNFEEELGNGQGDLYSIAREVTDPKRLAVDELKALPWLEGHSTETDLTCADILAEPGKY